MINHMRYLNTNLAVCEKPEGLGDDFIIIDHAPLGESCRTCFALVHTHNQREFDKEMEKSRLGTLTEDAKASLFGMRFQIAVFNVLVLFMTALVLWMVLRG